MTEECRPLLRRLHGWEKCRVGAFPGFRFNLEGGECLLVQSGIGLTRAGDASRALITAAHPSLLVSFGVAGALKDGLHIGDVVALRSAALLDQGLPGPAAPLATLSPAALAAAAQALQSHGARLLPGAAFTTRGSQTVRFEPPEPENPLLEMETAAIAQAAAEFTIPLLALRGVSDNPQQPLPIDPAAVIDANYRLRLGKLIRLLARHPGILFRAARFNRSAALAAENVAIAVLAALSQDPKSVSCEG
jgi:adenosylhomocysteine nucleosidase